MRLRKKIQIQGVEESLHYLTPNKSGSVEAFSLHCQKTHDFLKNFIKPNATVIDIGARDGDSLIPLLPMLKESSFIIAFEPDKAEFNFLTQNLNINKVHKSQINCNNFAIGENTELRDFVYDTKARNGGFKTEQLLRPGASQCTWDKEEQVQSVCWNDLEKDLKNKMLKASYLKVDTEGSDIEVLNELLPIIKESRPFIMTEWWPFTEKEIAKFTNSNKYIPINPDRRQIMTELDSQKGYCHDLFLIPAEKIKNYVL